MNNQIEEKIARIICQKPDDISCSECFENSFGLICKGFSKCRILEKTEEQLKYVVSPIDKNIFLKACAGSGKTEVVGMKAAYEINRWDKKDGGIAILSFTNDATDVIRDRVKMFSDNNRIYPHFIATLSSFIHSYIVQPFAYKYIKYEGTNSDYSIQVIDENLPIYANHWLCNFKCKIPYIFAKNRQEGIYAHQIGYDFGKKDFYINLKYDLVWLKDYYANSNVQSYIYEKGKTYWTEKYFREKFKECKNNFWKQGFANFDDMNILAVYILKSEIAKEIVKRFPLIFIDECQDLSENELCIIKLLQEKGCCIHFIGDLNQSIYNFKRVDPKKIYDYVDDFEKYSLNTNFRSCKEIVDFSNKLIKEESLSENVESVFNKNSLVYIEYDEPEDAIRKYINLLSRLKYEKKVNRILVKQNSLRKQLESLTQDTFDDKEPLIVALQLWKEKMPDNMIAALELAGKQISRWFGGGTSKKNYYCPNEMTSVFAWRIYLMHVLNEMEKNEVLTNFNMTYGEWHKSAKTILNSILEKQYKLISDFDNEKNRNLNKLIDGRNFGVSKGNKDVQIKIYENNFVIDIPIITIHGSKGCTYDTTLVLSSKTTSSEGGHWKKHWFLGDGEEKRIGYVACTRAKYLLVLGVPTLTVSDRKLLEEYGFISEKKLIK